MAYRETPGEAAIAAHQNIKEKNYWLKQLAGVSEKCFFPYDYPHRGQEQKIETVSFTLPRHLCSGLLKLSSQSDPQLHMILAAGLAVLLHKYTKKQDIIIGTPIYKPNTEGRYINRVLALRNQLQKNMSFKQLLLQVRETIIQANEFREYPVKLLPQQLNMDTPTSPAEDFPLFDIAILLENIHYRDYLRDININMIFSFSKKDNAIEGSLLYNSSRYSKDTVKKIIDYYFNVLSASLSALDSPIIDIELMSPEEKNTIINISNGITLDYPAVHQPLQHWFEAKAAEIPGNTALVFEEQEMSYRELNEKANQLARTLRNKGVGRNTIVALMVERSFDMIIAILAILKAGGAYLPIDTEYPTERIIYMLKDSQTSFLFTQKKVIENFPSTELKDEDANCEILVNENLSQALSHQPTTNLENINQPDDLVYLIYTSGSTGKPKGVMLEHKNVVNLIYFDFNYTNLIFDKLVQFHTIGFDASFHEIFCALLAGGKLYLIPKELITDIPAFLHLVKKNEIETLFLPTSFLKTIFSEQFYIDIFPSCVNHIQTAGEQLVISSRFKEYLQQNKIFLHNHYGPAETHVVTTFTIDPQKQIPELPPIGKPILNTSIYILDEYQYLLPIGIPGELYIGGIQVGRGYLNRPGLTHERFCLRRPGGLFSRKPSPWTPCKSFLLDRMGPGELFSYVYRTGDLAKWLTDSNIEFLGRIDHQVKIRGFRVEPGEIETRLLEHEDIKEVAVIVRQKDSDLFLCAYFVSEKKSDATELRSFLSKRLPDYMIPSYFVNLEKIPLTPNRKIDRKALPEPGFQIANNYSPPRNETEEKMTEIWADVLGIEKKVISIDSNFFDLGGHSLNATIMITKIHKEFNAKFLLSDVFKNPNIRQLAENIKKSKKDIYEDIKPQEKKEYYRQSSAQKRLFILYQMDSNSIAYNLPESFPLSESPDSRKLNDTFNKLIKRHESLRTSFHMTTNEPIQKIHNKVDFEIEYFDITTSTPISALMSSFIRPFDLSKAPLLRLGLIRQPAQIDNTRQEHLLIVDMHHIISDGISHEILVKDFMTLYEGNQLPALQIQYKDFALWQKGIKENNKETIKKQQDYWLNCFSKEIPALDLPNDFKRPEMQNFAGNTVIFVFGKKESLQLKNLAAQQEVTLFMLLMAIFNVLLSKVGSQEDIVVGTGAAGRKHAALQHIIGFFVNTLPIRNYPEKHKTFNEFLQEVKKNTLATFENQDYPFEDLVEKLEIPRDTSRNPLFDVMFVFQNIEQYLKQEQENKPDEENQETTVNTDDFKIIASGYGGISKFDITLFGMETGEQLSFAFQYNSKLFKQETLETFILHFKDIISAVLQDPNKTLGKIKNINPAKKSRILKQLHDELEKEVKIITKRTTILQDKINESFHHHKDNIAIEYKHNCMTYSQLEQRSLLIAQQLLNHKGIEKGTFIGILIDDRLEFILAMLGILKAGSVFVPLDTTYPQKRLEEMIRSTGTTSIIIDNDNFSRWASTPTTTGDPRLQFLLWEELVSREKAAPTKITPAMTYNPEDKIYIYFTSGSTGTPQAIVGKNSSLVHFIDWEIDTFAIKKNDRFSQLITPGFDAFLRDLFVPLCTGGVVCIPENKDITDPNELKNWIERSGIHLIHCVPSLFRLFNSNELTKENYKTLKFILLSGEKITPSDIAGWYDKFHERIQLVNLWGPTETTMVKTYYLIREKDIDRERIPVGKPMPGVKVIALNENMNICDQLVKGELYIQTPFSTFGYHNSPRLNQERFIPSPFSNSPQDILHRTGDLGRILPDGNIDLIGRNDRQVKIRGIRVEPEEIESVLVKHHKIKETVVTENNQLLCAYITGTGKNAPDVFEVKEYLAERLPRYMVPARLVKIEKIPRKPNGKVDYNALPHPLAEEESRFQPPRDQVEKKLAVMWADVLNLGKNSAGIPSQHSQQVSIGIRNNFFQLGGNSLNIIILLARIHKEFDVKLPVADIFKHPYIEKQAALIKQSRKETYSAVEPVEKREYYPLSSAQKRLYFLYLMDMKSIAYNMPQVIPLPTEPHTGKLKETFIKLVKRHESLRTSFLTINEEPVQMVYHQTKVEIEFYKVEIGTRVEDIISNFIRHFDLSQPPLLRIGLTKSSHNQHLLMVDMHHIISDGLSLELLVEDFTGIYTDEPLPHLLLQYKDFARWQNIEKENLQHQEKYWLNQFEDEIPVLNLPTDFPRPARQSFEGSIELFEIPAGDTDILKSMALAEGATLYMMLLALLNILFARLSGQEDIVIGTPVAGRRHADLEKIIGMFVNTLALRNFPRGEQTFREFLTEVKERSLEAFENQDYQYEDLVDKLSVDRNAGRNPLFDVNYTLQNFDVTAGSKTGKDEITDKQEQEGYQLGRSKFDMIFNVAQSGEKLVFAVEYCTKLFKKETIVRFINYFKNILSSISDKPGTHISEIEILTKKEKHQILYDFNKTAANYPENKTIHQLFAAQVEKTPDKVAVVESHQVQTFITYRELNKKSNQLARLLRANGAKPGTIAAIMLEPSLLTAIGVMAILKAGSAFLPLDTEYPPDRINYMLQDSSAVILLSQTGLIEKTKFQGEIIAIDDPQVYEGVNTNPAGQSDASHILYSIYTSGTTGKPKGVLITHRNLVNYITWFSQTARLTESDKTILTSSFAFDLGYTSFFPSILNGGELHLVPKEIYMLAEKLVAYIRLNKISYLKLTPSLFSVIVDAPSFSVENLNSMRLVLLGGEKINVNDVKKAHIYCPNLIVMNHYGPTESTIGSVAQFIDFNQLEAYGQTPTIGHPIYNTAIYILGRNLEFMPLGAAGELCISGHGLARGYLNRPELTLERFINHKSQNTNKGAGKIYNKKFLRGSRGQFLQKEPPGRRRQNIYKTGDLARWMPDGKIEFLGRIDRQVKIRGYRIELGEIRNRVLEIPGIKEAVVIDRIDNREKYLCAYIVTGNEKYPGQVQETAGVKQNVLDVSKIREILLEKLPDYMIPSYFMQIEAIPLTPNGKLQRQKLPAPSIQTDQVYAPPGNETEIKLVEIWGHVLGIEKTDIGIDSNFFQLGGHSLKAISLISRIHKELNVNVPLAKMFQTPTIKGLSGYIRDAAPEKYVSIEPIEKREYYALSSAQKRLYFLYQVEKQSIAYNRPQITPLSTKPDMEKLKNAFRHLIKRHESLRTSFLIKSEVPVQKVHDEVEFDIEYYDFPTARTKKGSKDKKKKKESSSINPQPAQPGPGAIKAFLRPFDLSRAPLIRVALASWADNLQVLMVDMHHIISDGMSMQVLQADFNVIFDEKPLPGLRIQYKDFSGWQNKEKENIENQEKYWLREFEDEIPILNLPIDYPRPALQSFAGSMETFEISAEKTKMLKSMAASEGATLYIVLLAIFNILMSKISSQEDVVIGTPVVGRRHADLEKIIGMFVNTLPLRNFPIGEKIFREFLIEVKEKALSAFENQDYQYEELVDKVSVTRDASRNPLFDVMYTLQSFNVTAGNQSENNPPATVKTGMNKPGGIQEQEGYQLGISKFDITFNGTESGEKLEFAVTYCTKLFKKETIRRLIKYFRNIISSIIAEPDRQISKINILMEQEKQQILNNFNNTNADYPKNKTLHRIFAEQVDRTPDAVAVLGFHQFPEAKEEQKGQKTREIKTFTTYRQLNEKSDQLAEILHRKGALPDTIVGIMPERSIEMIIGILGILKAGCAYMPIDPGYPQERRQYMLRDSGVNFLVQNSNILCNISGEKDVQTISIDDHNVFSSSYLLNFSTSRPSNLAYIIYTSGTTGKPKGSLIEHRNVVRLLFNDRFRFDFTPQDTWTLFHSHCFDFSVWEMYGALLNGARLVIIPKQTAREPGRFLQILIEEQVTVLNQTPAAFYQLVQHEMQQLTRELRLKYVIFGGDALNPPRLKSWKAKYPETKLINMYGITETTVHVTYKEIKSQEIESAVSNIGGPIPTLYTYILSQYQEPVPIGVPGEICVGGMGVCRGYLNRPELTSKKFIKNPFINKERLYRSGDLGRYFHNGDIEYLGRIDLQVKIRGHRIELGEIAYRLTEHNKIKDTLVIAREKQDREKYLCAYIVSDHPIDISELRSFLSTCLPDFMIPSYFIFLDHIPMTANGKIDRKALPGPEAGAVSDRYIPPGDEMQKKLAEIWSEILEIDIEKIGIETDFFQLGGNSLTIIQLISRIYQEFEVEIPITQIFTNPFIKNIAELIKNNIVAVDAPMILLNREETGKKIFCFPPQVGYGIMYKELASVLQDYSWYSFNFIEDMEAEERLKNYVHWITTVQPVGPYLLFGYSSAGALTFQVARALENHGHQVSDIIFWDCTFSKSKNPELTEEDKNLIYQQIDNLLQRFNATFLREKVIQKTLKYTEFFGNIDNLEKINANVHLILSDEVQNRIRDDKRPNPRCWEEFTDKKCSVYNGSGTHRTMFNPEGPLQKNAPLTRKILDSIETGRR